MVTDADNHISSGGAHFKARRISRKLLCVIVFVCLFSLSLWSLGGSGTICKSDTDIWSPVTLSANRHSAESHASGQQTNLNATIFHLFISYSMLNSSRGKYLNIPLWTQAGNCVYFMLSMWCKADFEVFFFLMTVNCNLLQKITF